jgi:hypothetical protein
MTIDPFNAPAPKFDTSAFRTRRSHFLEELSRSEHRRGARRALRLARPRPAIVLAALALAALIPVAALAVANDWWFLRPGGSPTPISGVVLVKTGTWDGVAWELTAYRSDTDGLCFSLTPRDSSNGRGGTMSCDSIAGVPRTANSKPSTPHAITYVITGKDVLPASIYGPVTDKAEEVVAEFANGVEVRTSTFAAPRELGAAVRFYATTLPASVPPLRIGSRSLTKLVGLDGSGRIVACTTESLPTAPLSACA